MAASCNAPCGRLEPAFWEKKPYKKLSAAEWEALCDLCGRCCFRTFITGFGKKSCLHYTRIACNYLDLHTMRCTCYSERFTVNRECNKISARTVSKLLWLPETCAYRLLCLGKPLPSWHPLISGTPNSVQKAGIRISNGIPECRVTEPWEHYELSSRPL